MKFVHLLFLGGLLAGIAVAIVSSSTKKLGRITGGTEAYKGEAPFIVLFSNGTFFCAGSIIHKHWVLTAANCLDQNNFDIIAGLHERNPKYMPSHVQRRTITDDSYIILHDPSYGENHRSYDIGLVFLQEPFDLITSPRINSVALPPREYKSIPEGKAALYGWGYITGGKLPEELQALATNIIKFADCAEMIEPDISLLSHEMCTDGPSGICALDSGDPLVRVTPNGVELIGVASWGESPCDSRTSPSVYTRVDKVLFWIDTVLTTYEHKDKCGVRYNNATLSQALSKK